MTGYKRTRFSFALFCRAHDGVLAVRPESRYCLRLRPQRWTFRPFVKFPKKKAKCAGQE
jgi:hypothetical protein